MQKSLRCDRCQRVADELKHHDEAILVEAEPAPGEICEDCWPEDEQWEDDEFTTESNVLSTIATTLLAILLSMIIGFTVMTELLQSINIP